MSPKEFQQYLDAFPGEYRKPFAFQRAKIYERFETCKDMVVPYRELQLLFSQTAGRLGLKDSLSQAILDELVLHSSNLELHDAALRYETLKHVVQFKKWNAEQSPVNYWAGEEPLVPIQDEVATYYAKEGPKLEHLVSTTWEPTSK